MPRGEVLAFPSGEWAIVHGEGHLNGWLVDRHPGQRNWMLRVGNRIANAHLVEAGHCDDFPRFGPFHIRSFEAGVDRKVRHFSRELYAVLSENDHILTTGD